MSEIENESENVSRAIPLTYVCSCGITTEDPATFDTLANPCSVGGFHAWAIVSEPVEVEQRVRDELQRVELGPALLADVCNLYADELPHSRHMIGPQTLNAQRRVELVQNYPELAELQHVTCPGVPELGDGELGDDEGTYVDMLTEYVAAQQSWIGPAQTPLVFHLRKLARRLDTDPTASASLSSAYLQAFSRLDRQRPGSKTAGDGLTPPGAQGSIFDELDG